MKTSPEKDTFSGQVPKSETQNRKSHAKSSAISKKEYFFSKWKRILNCFVVLHEIASRMHINRVIKRKGGKKWEKNRR